MKNWYPRDEHKNQVSRNEGIPTFRGADGFWTIGSENYKPQDICTYAMFEQHPEEVWKWFHQKWRVCREAAPNPGHVAIAELQRLVERQDGGTLCVFSNLTFG